MSIFPPGPLVFKWFWPGLLWGIGFSLYSLLTFLFYSEKVFPTLTIYFEKWSWWINIIVIFVFIVFSLLSYASFFLFTRSFSLSGKRKEPRWKSGHNLGSFAGFWLIYQIIIESLEGFLPIEYNLLGILSIFVGLFVSVVAEALFGFFAKEVSETLLKNLNKFNITIASLICSFVFPIVLYILL